MSSYVNMTLSIAGAALGLLGLILALMAIRDARRWRAHCGAVEYSLEAIRRQFDLLVKSGVQTGRTADRIGEEFSLVADRLEQLEIRGAAQPLDQAIDSARLGATPGTLARKFGLSRLEAELVSRLHGRKKTA
jgi:hypothetical protein